MRCLSLVSALVCALVGAATSAQCPTAYSHRGFHEEKVGYALATDGDEALFGHLTGFNCGLYERRGNDWWWRTALMGGSGSGRMRMGTAVALRGDVAALGDAWDYSLAASSLFPHGAAVIYERSADVWTRIIDLYPPTPTVSGWYGRSVAISDDASRVIVGAPGRGTDGEVYVYERGSGWGVEQTITGASLSTPGSIGGAVAILAGHLFLSASQGVVVFALQGGTWTEIGTLAPAQLAPSAGFGGRIVGDGTRIVIGALGQPSGSETGVLFEYDLSLPSWMSAPTTITPPAGSAANWFGRALALDGNRMAVGAQDRAFEYRRDGTGTWQPFAEVSPPTGGFSADFGEAVGLYSAGILVGDSSHDDDPQAYPRSPGGVHAFDLVDHGKPFQGCGRGIAIEFGGSVQLELDWPQDAGKSYHVLGSLTGTGPVNVAGLQLPLTPDLYMQVASAVLVGFTGTLDGNGRATVSWNMPQGLPPTVSGLTFYHAALAYDANLLAASNAVTSELVLFY